MTLIDISNVNKLKLLHALWLESNIAPFFTTTGINAPEWDDNDALQAISNGYIDYFKGRLIKTNLSGDKCHTDRYNFNNGENKFEMLLTQVMCDNPQ